MNRIKHIALVFFCFGSLFLFSQNKEQQIKTADSLLDAKDNATALKWCLQLVEAYPKDAEAYTELAFCYNVLKDDQKCLEAVEKAESFNSDPEIKYNLYYLKADCYSRLQKNEEAMRYCMKYVNEYPADCYGLDLRGWLYYCEGKYDLAITDFLHAMDDTQMDSDEKTYAMAMLGSCYLQKENIQKAKFYSGLSLAADKNNYDARLLSANILVYEKEFEAGLSIFKELYANDTSDVALIYSMAETYYYLKEYDRSLNLFKEYVKHLPGTSEADNMIGWILFRQKKYDEALPYAALAIKEDKTNSSAYDTYGCILYKKENYTDALKELNMALKLDNKSTNSYYFRALCYLKVNRKSEACKDFEKVLLDKEYKLPEGETPAQELINFNCKK